MVFNYYNTLQETTKQPIPQRRLCGLRAAYPAGTRQFGRQLRTGRNRSNRIACTICKRSGAGKRMACAIGSHIGRQSVQHHSTAHGLHVSSETTEAVIDEQLVKNSIKFRIYTKTDGRNPLSSKRFAKDPAYGPTREPSCAFPTACGQDHPGPKRAAACTDRLNRKKRLRLPENTPHRVSERNLRSSMPDGAPAPRGMDPETERRPSGRRDAPMQPRTVCDAPCTGRMDST